MSFIGSSSILRRKRIEGESRSFGFGIQRHLGAPSRAVFIITCLLLVVPFAPPQLAAYLGTIHQVLAIAMVLALGWFATGAVYVAEAAFLRKYDVKAEDNVRARQVHTQMLLFRRVVISFIAILTLGAILWTFHDERIWKAGSGLVASAGIASLLLAAAAKSTVSNFLAGMQIALTSPIRIDDVVVVQGEWGKIEEINAAYVVIHIWDDRRLVVPLSWFIENSFANWTRRSADILGTAFLYVDYAVPVDDLREQLQRIVSTAPQWDKRVCVLQVTDLKEHTMEIRCLVSSRNSGDNFDLRCIVREQMIAYIRDHYPEAFPRVRLDGPVRIARDAEDGALQQEALPR